MMRVRHVTSRTRIGRSASATSCMADGPNEGCIASSLFCLPANLSMDPGIPVNPPSWKWLPARSAPLSSLRPVDHPRLSYRHAWLDENAARCNLPPCEEQEATSERQRTLHAISRGNRFAIASSCVCDLE